MLLFFPSPRAKAVTDNCKVNYGGGGTGRMQTESKEEAEEEEEEEEEERREKEVCLGNARMRKHPIFGASHCQPSLKD